MLSIRITQKKGCSYVRLIVVTQAAIMVAFFIYFHWHHNDFSAITYSKHRPKGSYAKQDLYMNGELNFNESLQDEECVAEFLQKYLDYCNRALVPPYDVFRSNSDLPLCPCLPPSSLTETSSEIRAQLTSSKASKEITFDSCSPVLLGGHWSPTDCLPRQRVAIIVPFRNRDSHLRIFLQFIHPFLQKQLLNYTVFVVEQLEPFIFNRASLLNVGFQEASSGGQFDCFIFHDVDALPEDHRNYYGCYKMPRHVAPYIDKHRYKMHYVRMFGRANAFTKKQFELANGFSNEFYGWGGEDDDLLNRIETVNMTFLRFPNCIATYTVIEHLRDIANPISLRRFIGYQQRPNVYAKDGLRNLVYKIKKYEKRLLYTRIAVSLPDPPSYLQWKQFSTTPSDLKNIFPQKQQKNKEHRPLKHPMSNGTS